MLSTICCHKSTSKGVQGSVTLHEAFRPIATFLLPSIREQESARCVGLLALRPKLHQLCSGGHLKSLAGTRPATSRYQLTRCKERSYQSRGSGTLCPSLLMIEPQPKITGYEPPQGHGGVHNTVPSYIACLLCSAVPRTFFLFT